MSLAKSEERLKNSRHQVNRYRFNLPDIKDLFYGYEEMDEEERENGTLVAVLGLDKKGLPDMHLVLYDANGEVCYSGNDSHPCPPFPEEDCGGG